MIEKAAKPSAAPASRPTPMLAPTSARAKANPPGGNGVAAREQADATPPRHAQDPEPSTPTMAHEVEPALLDATVARPVIAALPEDDAALHAAQPSIASPVPEARRAVHPEAPAAWPEARLDARHRATREVPHSVDANRRETHSDAKQLPRSLVDPWPREPARFDTDHPALAPRLAQPVANDHAAPAPIDAALTRLGLDAWPATKTDAKTTDTKTTDTKTTDTALIDAEHPDLEHGLPTTHAGLTGVQSEHITRLGAVLSATLATVKRVGSARGEAAARTGHPDPVAVRHGEPAAVGLHHTRHLDPLHAHEGSARGTVGSENEMDMPGAKGVHKGRHAGPGTAHAATHPASLIERHDPDTEAPESGSVVHGAATGHPTPAGRPRSPQRPGEALTAAQQKIADLTKQAAWKKDQVKAQKIEKARRVGATGLRQSHAAVVRAQAELKQAKAETQRAQTDTHAEGAQKKQAVHATIASLTRELEQSIAHDIERVQQALAKDQSELETRLDGQRQSLVRETDRQRSNLAQELAAKQKVVEDRAGSERATSKKQIESQQAELERQAVEETKQLRETSRAEAKRVDDAARVSAKAVEDQGEADARLAEQQAETDAARARSDAKLKAAELRAAAEKKKSGVVDTVAGWFSRDPGALAIQAGEARAQDLHLRGKMSGETLRTKAKGLADGIRADGQKTTFKITTAADERSRAINKETAEARIRAENAVKAEFKRIEDLRRAAATAVETEIVTAKQAIDRQLGEGLADITRQLATTKQKLQADTERSLTQLKAKAEVARQKLANGVEKDIQKLEQMVHRTCAELDHAAEKTASDLHVTVKQAELKAAETVTARLAAIDKLAERALAQIDDWVQRESRAILKAAETLEQQIAAIGKQSAAANEARSSKAVLSSLTAMADAALPAIHDKEVSAQKQLTGELQLQQAKIEDLDHGKKDDELDRAKASMAAMEKSEHWYHTDSKSIVRDLKDMKPAEREALRVAYKAKTGEDLDVHLSKDLTAAEMKLLKAEWSGEAMAIAEAKLECAKGRDLSTLGTIAGAVIGGAVGAYVGHELGHAAQSLTTDGDAIKKTLADLTPEQRKELAQRYEKETGQKLDNFLGENLAGKELKEARDLAPKPTPPAAIKPVPPEEMKAQEDAAKQMREAMDGFHTNTDKLLAAMKGKSAPEIAALKAAYGDKFKDKDGNPRNLDDDLENKLTGSQLKEAKAYLSADPVDIAVAQMQEAQDHWYGSDNKKIQEALEAIKDPDKRAKLAVAYEKQTGLKLDTMLTTQMTGMDKDLAQALAKGDEKAAEGIKMDKALNGGMVTSAADWMADKTGLPREAVRQGVGAAIMSSPLGVVAQLATGGTSALGSTSFGADDAEVNKLLEACKSPAERQTMIEAYKARTGKDLKADLTQKLNVGIGALDGTGQLRGDIATALLEGDTATASAAKMELSTRGIGKDVVAAFVESQTYGLVNIRKDLNDQKAIFAELEGKSPQERKAIIAAYARKYGNNDAKAFDAFLGQNLGGMDLEKAALLEKDGKVPPEFAVAYALDAWRTDNAGLMKVLDGKSKEEIKAIRIAYKEKYGKDLDDEIDANTHGQTNFYVKLALEGEPENAQEKIARMKAIHEYERGAGGENKILQQVAQQVTGVPGISGFHNISNFVTDLTSDAGKDLDRQYDQIIGLENKMKEQGGKLDKSQQDELDKFLRYGNQDKESYQAAKDAVTTALATAATVVVGAAVSVLTAGAAAPAVIAAVAAIAGGIAGIGVKMVMKGDAYGTDELMVDAGMTVVNALTAGTLKLKVLESLAKASPLVFSAVSGAVAAALSSGAQSMMSDTEAHNLLQALAHAGSAAKHGALSGAVSGVIAHGLNEGMDAKFGKATSAFGAGLRGFASGTVSGVAGALTDPAVLEGDWVAVANRLATAGLSAGIMAGGDSAGGYLHAQYEAVGTAAKAARQAEIAGKSPAEQRAVYEQTLAGEMAKLHGLSEPETKGALETGTGTGDEHQPSPASDRAKVLGESMTPQERTAATDRANALGELIHGPGGLDLPGTQKMRVVPDHTENLPPGCVRESEARNYMKVAAMAENVPAVKELLEIIRKNGGEVTFGEGSGSYRKGDQINLATGMTPEEMMGVLAHEAHHLETFDRDVSINAKDRASYEKAALRNEAEAQVNLFEAHRQLLEQTGKITGQNEFGAKAYRTAMIEGEAAALAENPLATKAQISAKQREYAVAALENEFATNAKPSTSYNEKGELIPGKPATYKELYGEWFDKHSPNGADAVKAKAEGKPFNPTLEAQVAPAAKGESTGSHTDEPSGKRLLTPEDVANAQTEIKNQRTHSPEELLQPGADPAHVEKYQELISKGYYFNGDRVLCNGNHETQHYKYTPELGFREISAQRKTNNEPILAGKTPREAFEQLDGQLKGSALDKWVSAATEAIEKLGDKLPTGIKDKLDPAALKHSATYESAIAAGASEADALVLARKQAVVDRMLAGVEVDPQGGLSATLKEDTVRGKMKGQIPLDEMIAQLPFDEAKAILDKMAPSDKGNTFEAWETKLIKDNLRARLTAELEATLPAGTKPTSEQLAAIERKLAEQITAQVVVGNRRSTDSVELREAALENLARTNPGETPSDAAVTDEMAKVKARREADVRQEAVDRLTENLDGKAPTEEQIAKEIEKISRNRKADIVEDMLPTGRDEQAGVRVKELKSTGQGFNEHDVDQINDLIEAAVRGDMIGDPPKRVDEIVVKFADRNGAHGSAAELVEMLFNGNGKFAFEVADPVTGKSEVFTLEQFRDVPLTKIKAAIESRTVRATGQPGVSVSTDPVTVRVQLQVRIAVDPVVVPPSAEIATQDELHVEDDVARDEPKRQRLRPDR